MNAIKRNWIFLSLSLLFLILNIIRIKFVAITNDEAYSYIYYISKTYRHIVTNGMSTANNHILSSVFSKFFIDTFQDNLFYLRISTFLAQVVYLYFSFRLSVLVFQKKYQSVFMFILLQLSLYLFQFWGLSRGYGLSISCMLASVYFYSKFFLQKKNIHFLVSLLFATASVYSNMSSLNYLAALSAVAFFVAVVRKEKIVFVLGSIFVTAIVIYLLLANIIKTLIEAKEFYFGGDNGFVTDTIQSLLRQLLFFNEDGSFLLALSYGIALFVLLLLGVWVYRAIKSKKVELGFVFVLLLTLPAFSTIAQHYLFDTKFLIERTGLFFYPLFIISGMITLTLVKRAYANTITIVLVVFMTIHFAMHYDTTTTKDWYLDKPVPAALEKIVSEKHDKPVRLYIGWRLTAATYYTIHAKYKEHFQKLEWYTERFYEPGNYDYYFLSHLQSEDIPQEYKVDTAFLDNQVLLYKRR